MSMKNIASWRAQTQLTPLDPTQIQPNAVDLKVDKIFRIKPNVFTLTQNDKTHRGSEIINPSIVMGDFGDYTEMWTLEPGTYEVLFEGEINVGISEAGFVITRSTLNRNGVFLTSGLYDSGYTGVMAGAMHVTTGPMSLERGARLGQYLCFTAESVKEYDGSYGKGSEHDSKYGA